MDNKKKMESLKNEYNATMKHANDIREEYIKIACEQAIEDAFNELSASEKTILLLGLLTGAIDESDIFSVDEILKAKAAADQDMEQEHQENLVKEVATLFGDTFTIHIVEME